MRASIDLLSTDWLCPKSAESSSDVIMQQEKVRTMSEQQKIYQSNIEEVKNQICTWQALYFEKKYHDGED